MPSPPFVDRGTGELDTKQLIAEAIPLAKLVGAVGAASLVPVAPLLFGVRSGVGLAFTIAAWFVLAVGAGLVLVYVVARGTQLAR